MKSLNGFKYESRKTTIIVTNHCQDEGQVREKESERNLFWGKIWASQTVGNNRFSEMTLQVMCLAL